MDFLFKPGGGGDANEKKEKISSKNDMKIDFDEKIWKEDHPADLVGALDQGTSSTRFVVYTRKGLALASAQVEHAQIYPPGEVGWHEHDPIVLAENSLACICAVQQVMKQKGVKVNNQGCLQAIGITNQRETTIAWNRETGVPYYNAIVWDDTRTAGLAHEIANGDINRLRAQTGLPLASYFAGTKVKWLLNNVPALRHDLADPAKALQVCFGTVDSWLVFQLTGKPSTHSGALYCQGEHATDVTNASRWLFLDLYTQNWDQALVDTVCHPHHLPVAALPTVCPSSHIFGSCSPHLQIPLLQNLPIAAVLGDQQAALFGQTAFRPGQAKNTYGTGMFLMMNTGQEPIPSTHGLLTTIAYQIAGEPIQYALEGSVSHSGSTIQWLRDKLQIIDAAPDTEDLSPEQNDGLYFVPAFSGLFCPHWRSDARACLVGLTTTHHKGHVCRAALEAAAYQTKEVLQAMEADSGVALADLKVDGGATNNRLLMQFQCDMLNVPVIQPVVMETTSLGAAYAAGLAVGVWQSTAEVAQLWAVAHTYTPQMEEATRRKYFAEWKKAVSKSLGWVEDNVPEEADAEEHKKRDLVFDMEQTGVSSWTPSSVAAAAMASLMIGFLIGRIRRS